MKIEIKSKYREQEVSLTVDSEVAKTAGVTYETLLELTLKYYAPRQYASRVESAIKKDKEIPDWDADVFIKWLLAEKAASTGEPSKADKAEGAKLAAAFMERYQLCKSGVEGAGDWEEVEPKLYANLIAQMEAGKQGFKAPAYDPEEAYGTPEFWAGLMRSYRLFQPKLSITL